MNAQPQDQLRKFYDFRGTFYLLVRTNGVFVVETPENMPQETILRLFMSEKEAIRHRSLSQFRVDTKVGGTTLINLWSVLDKIEESSFRQYNRPVRVEVSAIGDDGDPVTIETLHSTYSPQS